MISSWWNLGWSKEMPRDGDEVHVVSHLDAEYKRAAFGTVVPYEWVGLDAGSFMTAQWRLGTTEPGSSGAPVFVTENGQQYAVGVVTSATVEEDLDHEAVWGPYCDPVLRTSFMGLEVVYERIKRHVETGSPPPPDPDRPSARVTLGLSGEIVTLVQDTDGTWRLANGDAVVSGVTTVSASNGNSYRLVQEAGTWAARFVPHPGERAARDQHLQGRAHASRGRVVVAKLDRGDRGRDGDDAGQQALPAELRQWRVGRHGDHRIGEFRAA